MTSKILILLDCSKTTNDKKWLENYFLNCKRNVSFLFADKKLSKLIRDGKLVQNYFLQIKQAIISIFQTGSYSTIVCWYSVTGLIVNYLCRSLHLNRKIVIMNWLFNPERRTWTNFLEKAAVMNEHCYIMINSRLAIERLIQHYNLGESNTHRLIFNPDVYDGEDMFISHNPKSVNDRYFFSGGMTNRDWALYAKIAAAFPTYKFICCALKEDFESKVTNIPNNIVVKYNVPSDEYFNLMQESFTILLPLVSKEASGIINIIKAIQLGKICLVSHSDATAQYFSEDNKSYLMRSEDDWMHAISDLIKLNDEEYKKQVVNFQTFIIDNYSPESMCKRLENII